MTQAAILVLENGRVFRGFNVGPQMETIAEVVFNTSLSGYQEILSDPSYAGQIVVMTAPQIGNTGVNEEDMEADTMQCSGLVMRHCSPVASNWRSESSLPEFLQKHSIPAIEGIDTRALTRVLRTKGSMRGAISTATEDVEGILSRIRSAPTMEGRDLASSVGCKSEYSWEESRWVPEEMRSLFPVPDVQFEIVAYDFGIKKNILRDLRSVGCRIQVVPSDTPAKEILSRKVDGVFLSNGPGDPAAMGAAAEAIAEIARAKVPVFGICLGHQLLSLGLGASTYKLPFGHHGGNHPVMDLVTRQVAVTSHNHGFSVSEESLPDSVRVSHISLNDKSVEGIASRDLPCFGVQYHPEGGPGPHDALPLFTQFAAQMAAVAK